MALWGTVTTVLVINKTLSANPVHNSLLCMSFIFSNEDETQILISKAVQNFFGVPDILKLKLLSKVSIPLMCS